MNETGRGAAVTIDTETQQRNGTGRRKVWIRVGAIVAALVAVFYLGGGWYFSGVLNQRALDAAQRKADLAERDYDFEVAAVDSGSITLQLGEDPGNLVRPGVWGVDYAGGFGRAHDVIDRGSESVTRNFELLQGSLPAVGEMVEFESLALPEDPTTLLDPAPVAITYPGPLGDYPAWWFPADGDTWVILVHGNSMNIADHAKLVPALHGAGYPVLEITYRNGIGAPEDPDGKLQYGVTEWKDLEAAVEYALNQGARRVDLIGASMGGAVVTHFLYESSDAPAVGAVVLEAPMLDFGRTVDVNAAREKLPLVGLSVPQSLTSVAKWMASWRFGVDWKAMDLLMGSDRLRSPVLIFHGTEDTDVPIETSRDLPSLRPELVTLVEVPGASHMAAWNVNPEGFESQMLAFLAAH
jgi:pimeloyl-ACP methyl ester carboxylesterase